MVFRVSYSTDALTNVAASLLLTPTSHFLRTHILARQRAVIAPLWPASTVICVGSFPSGLALHGSDLDVVISAPQGTPVRTTTWAQRLHRANIYAGLSANTPMLVAGRNTAAPVLKYVVPATEETGEDVPVDVTFQPLALMVSRNDFLTLHLAARPGAKEALVLLKAWIKAADFDMPLYGGIGSYGLALSMVAFLNRYERVGDKLPKTPWTVVTEYLRYYTHPDLNMFRGLVDVRTGEIKEPGPIGKVLLMADPILRTHVVGAKSVRMMSMVKEMSRLLERLENAGPGVGEDEVLKMFTTMETPVVKTEAEKEAERLEAALAGNRAKRFSAVSRPAERTVKIMKKQDKVVAKVLQAEEASKETETTKKEETLKEEMEVEKPKEEVAEAAKEIQAGGTSKEGETPKEEVEKVVAEVDAPKEEVEKVVAEVDAPKEEVEKVVAEVDAPKEEAGGVEEMPEAKEVTKVEEKVEADLQVKPEEPEAAEETKVAGDAVHVLLGVNTEEAPKEAAENR